MKALKTIVATAVIVFTLTTVATAAVRHVTQTGTSAMARKAQATYTVRLTERQLEQLAATLARAQTGQQTTIHKRTGDLARTKHAAHAQRHTQRHAQTHRGSVHAAMRHQYASTKVTTASHHVEPLHHAATVPTSSSWSGSHHSDHDGGHGGGCD